jgi:hypothetical protein
LLNASANHTALTLLLGAIQASGGHLRLVINSLSVQSEADRTMDFFLNQILYAVNYRKKNPEYTYLLKF